jgi:diguanylate cyclase (GGDEF)-like protein/PAS domain S-box-containing protein
MRAICLSEDWDAGQYWYLDEDKAVMAYFTGWDVDTKVVREVVDDSHRLEIGKGEGVVGVVWESAEPLWISDMSKEKRLLRKVLAVLTGWRQGLLFPVTSRDKVVGVLVFYAVSIQEPDERMLNLLQVLGRLIGNYQYRLDTLQQLKESEERYQSTVELAAIGFAHVNFNGQFIHVNPRFCAMLGYTLDEFLAMGVKDITHPEDIHLTDDVRDKLRKKEIEFFKIEKRYLHKNGSAIWASLTVTTKWDKYGNSLYDISIVEDISARVEAERQVHYLATHDVLTALPNRSLFLQLLSQAVESAKRYTRQFAVIFIDLDQFKQINDTLGHEAGDTVLMEMASRFKQCLRNSDVVARLGGDEFVVLVQEIHSENQVAVLAGNLLDAAIKPVLIKGQECRVTASLGICMYPSNAVDEQSLMQTADKAMYQAKGAGKNNFQFYSGL